MNFPTIISLPDGTDIIIAPTNEPLGITISLQGCLPNEKEKSDEHVRHSNENSLEDSAF